LGPVRILTVASQTSELVTKSAPPELVKYYTVPMIRMRGYWLKSAGFQIGAKIRVEVGPGRLVISQVEEPPTDRVRTWRVVTKRLVYE
jgi:hypothetical protein